MITKFNYFVLIHNYRRHKYYLAILLAFALGIIFSGKNFKRQISLTIETSLRNPGLAYLIATESFSLERVNMAMVPYVFTQSLWWCFVLYCLNKHKRR